MKRESKSADRKLIENAAETLRLFADGAGGKTQIDMMKELPLKRTSVYYAFEFLEQAGFIVKTGEQAGRGRGIPRLLWELNPGAGSFLAAYLFCGGMLLNHYDFRGALLASKRIPLDGAIEEAIDIVARKAKELKRGSLCGIAMLLAGIVDRKRGEVASSKRWKLQNYPLLRKLCEALPKGGVPPLVLIENRARAAAWGDHRSGRCSDVDNSITLLLEEGERDGASVFSGAGSGVVIDGHPFSGGHGAAGELDESFRRWRSQIAGLSEPFSLKSMSGSQAEALGECFGEGLSHIVNYLSAEKVSLCFDGCPPNEVFAASFRRKLIGNLLPFNAMAFPVELSKAGSELVPAGGVDMLRHAYFNLEGGGLSERLRAALPKDE